MFKTPLKYGSLIQQEFKSNTVCDTDGNTVLIRPVHIASESTLFTPLHPFPPLQPRYTKLASSAMFVVGSFKQSNIDSTTTNMSAYPRPQLALLFA